jgi:diaminohydroxyphosphoribosylaminopyrimidine deaminase/5-amino-6-(5-phosphoribosylamino)uracil reductase
MLVMGHKLNTKLKTAFTKAGAEVMEPPEDEPKVDLKTLVRDLGRRDITSIMVEGGGILLGSLFDLGLVDKVIVFIAPIIIGGAEAKTPVAGEGVGKVTEAFRLERTKVGTLGDDVVVSGYVSR